MIVPMTQPLVFLSIPNLREKDVAVMARLRELTAGGEIADLRPSFPAVTCSVQANMTTGRLPRDHGVVANGLYWRERRLVGRRGRQIRIGQKLLVRVAESDPAHGDVYFTPCGSRGN